MADDFGDDAGDKLLDWSIRLIIEKGRHSAYTQSKTFTQALRNAQDQIRQQAGDGGMPAEELARQEGWAKLDLHEFTEIEGWDSLREVLDATLGEHGLTHEWFEDEQEGKQYLLFRTEDAPQLADAFGSVAEQAERAHEQAIEVIERSRQMEISEKELDEPDAKDARDDPRRNLTLREKVAAVRAYAEEISRTGRDDRAPERQAKRERQRE